VVERKQLKDFHAELHRLAARMLLAGPEDAPAAESHLKTAIRIAQRQRARMWELRAARDLANLWAERGERQKAHDLLAPVYGWFTEGFDTPDLVEAKALLDSLA
jgi:predicted ATPase